MIELLKFLANNLEPEQLLRVAEIISRNPEMIDEDTFLEIINEVEGFEMHRISKHEYDKIKDRFDEIDQIRQNSELYKLLKDNNIGLN